MEAREKNKLSTSQPQAVIRLIVKKERDKRFIKIIIKLLLKR